MHDDLVKRLRKCATEAGACKTCELDSNPSCTDVLMEQAADAIEELSKSRWIPVTERLPGEFGRYLCRYRVEDGETIGYCTDFGRYDPEHGEWFVGTVTHWMPLPPAPKEEE